MDIVLNGNKVTNPIAKIGLVLFSFFVVGVVIALLVFLFLPLVGIFISGVVGLIIVILTPIFLWLLLPAIFISMIAWCFSQFSKK